MRRLPLLASFLGLALALAAWPAAAQTDQEARLREALRRATAEARSAQDSQARLQAEVTEARAERDALRQELAAARARLAELDAAPPGPSPEQLAEMEQLRATGRALAEQNAALQQALARWQGSQAEAVAFARQKEAERLATDAALGRARAAIDACEVKNGQLITAANEILALYQTPDFQTLVSRSREPLVGIWRVRLENIVQAHEDRIREGRFYRAAHPVPTPPPATPMPAQEAPARRAAR
jgi:DNA repair exonuclease SbcCD ATPase subunit